MKQSTHPARILLMSAVLLASAPVVHAQESTAPADRGHEAMLPAQIISPEARAVLDRMTAYLQTLQSFSIETDASRDEVVALGYKIQNNEHSRLVVTRPDRLRAEVSGDIRNRTFVYNGETLVMHSPDDQVYVETEAPDTLEGLIETLLDRGVEMPLIDVLYNTVAGTLTETVRGGVLVGPTMIDGVACDQLAFRQPAVDWQIWVEQGARPLPRRILITTRHEVGEPQYQATLRWNLKPKIHASTFEFAPPPGTTRIPLAGVAEADAGNP